MIATQNSFLPLAGGTMKGNITFAGSAGVAGSILDNKGNVVLTILNGGNLGAHPPKGIQLLGNNSLFFDSTQSSFIMGDGSGNVSLTGLATTIAGQNTMISSTPVTASAGSVTGTKITSSLSLTGTANGTGFVLNSAFSGSTTGTKTLGTLQRNGSTVAWWDQNGNFVSANFDAAQLIYVDGDNGSDAQGLGTAVSPFATIAHAMSIATTGQCVYVMPGVYVENILMTAGVALRGSGRGVTILRNWTAYTAVLCPRSNCLIADLTLDTANPSGLQNGIAVTLASGDTATPTNVVFENVDVICNYDGVNPGGNGFTGGGAGAYYWTFRGCRFHGACWMYYDQLGISALFLNCDWIGDGSISRLDGNPQYAAVAAYNPSSRVTVLGGNISFVDPTTAANLWACAGVVSGTGAMIEFAATNVVINCPNAASTANIAPFALLTGFGTGAAIQVGEGVTYSPYSYFGNPALAMPTVQQIGVAQSLAVSSSAVTPYFSRHRGEFTVSADAGGLASNTLTVNAPINAAGDGNRIAFRIRNTNSGSTAMTLSLNGVYNLGSISVGTIAAGKRAYLEFCFDAENAKWDLVGFVGGL